MATDTKAVLQPKRITLHVGDIVTMLPTVRPWKAYYDGALWQRGTVIGITENASVGVDFGNGLTLYADEDIFNLIHCPHH